MAEGVKQGGTDWRHLFRLCFVLKLTIFWTHSVVVCAKLIMWWAACRSKTKSAPRSTPPLNPNAAAATAIAAIDMYVHGQSTPAISPALHPCSSERPNHPPLMGGINATSSPSLTSARPSAACGTYCRFRARVTVPTTGASAG